MARTNPQLVAARARMRAANMPDRCTIEAWLTVRNTRGQVVQRQDYVRATGVPCRLTRDIHPVFGAESGGAYGRTGQLVDTTALAWTLALPWGTTSTEADRVVLADGDTYEVTSVDGDSSYGVEVFCGLIRLGVEQPVVAEGA